MTSFTVNGQAVHYRLDPETPLLWALRDASNLTGTKYGCGTGHCGACTVHIDGRAVLSCTVPIGTLEGTLVTTIEGLSADRSHPVQQAWAAEQVSQCGFCQPGMIMAAAALIERADSPSDADIDAALGNLCRCGTYPRIREAVRRAVRARSGREQVAGAPPPGIAPEDAARATPALRAVPPRPDRRR
jgi:isoquinoline 1-oxidoreductase alpha subunit